MVLRVLKADEIREKFNQESAAYENDRLKIAVQNLSAALAELQEGGIDVSFEAQGSCSQEAFDISKGSTVSLSGLLKLGHTHYLLVVATKRDNQECLAVHVSYLSNKTGRIDGRSYVFDLKNDPEAMVKFQEHIIKTAVGVDFIEKNDTHKSFDRPPRTQRFVLGGKTKP